MLSRINLLEGYDDGNDALQSLIEKVQPFLKENELTALMILALLTHFLYTFHNCL